ncbi:F-box/LRR-repeat protein 16 [Orchesella cincta]|uniref:F-box/LRR-repeat protein 16 n=1 Tax=Orchesella cincta TaxID=48709 RepID=A0A1D2N7V3_ORCCI|nr:F-box/LRR-repeat protein 16 [Orchesella cincta]
MIDRASAEISKCIMRLKRNNKKPPEIPPKPNSVATGPNNSHSNNAFFQQNNVHPTPGIGASGGGSGVDSSSILNRHGGVAVLPHHIATLSGGGGGAFMSGGSAGSLTSTPTTPRRIATLTRKTPKHNKRFRMVVNSSQLCMDEEFLKYIFGNYFSGSEKLILPTVCRKWRDTSYGMGRSFWGELIPVLKCKELRGIRADLNAGIRRRFYGGLIKRGFASLKLHSATDDDAEDVMIHYPQGAALVETLKISSSSLTDKALFNLLDHLQSLQDLELMSCNEITEDGLNAALPKKLRRLVISDCIHVADVSVSYIARTLICLSSFEIQAYHVTDTALAAFNPKNNSALTTLKLTSCWELTNQTVLHIVSGLPQLRNLSLSGCSKITDEGVEVLAENLHLLKILDLSWCPRVTDASLECIACDLNCLETLILDRCSLVSDLGIGYLATMSSLRVLSLRWCSIRDASVHHIISMKRLQYLSLAGCTSIAPSTLCSLSTLRNLKELELTNCGVTPQVLHFLHNTLNCVIIE